MPNWLFVILVFGVLLGVYAWIPPEWSKPESFRPEWEWEAIVREEFSGLLAASSSDTDQRQLVAKHELPFGKMEAYRFGDIGMSFLIYDPESDTLWWRRKIKFETSKDVREDDLFGEAKLWIEEGLTFFCQTGRFGVGPEEERSRLRPAYKVETSSSFESGGFPQVALFRLDSLDGETKKVMWLKDTGWLNATIRGYE